MTALLVFYMVNQLLLTGHVEHIGGFSGFRAALESVVGPLSTQALASQIFGLYSGFVYFTPLLGGMIADRWIGQRNAVVIGALSIDRKSTRLNSSHGYTSYAVFCLKKKNTTHVRRCWIQKRSSRKCS